jgi:two-component system sensor histidine kinase/response regulator
VERALINLDGKKELYLAILRMFHESYAGTAEAIQAALRSNDLELARRLVHTLKGLAGQIGAEPLRAAAKDLEMAIAEGNEKVYDLKLADLRQQKLATVIASIAKSNDLGF